VGIPRDPLRVERDLSIEHFGKVPETGSEDKAYLYVRKRVSSEMLE
jgi:hypothetical protein